MRNIFGSNPVLTMARLVMVAASAAVLLQTAPALVSARDHATASAPVAAPRPATPQPAATPDPASTATATATLSSIQVRRELDIPHWLPPGEFVWNEAGAPARGQVIVVVNIRARVISVYRAGHEIGRSSLIYGGDDKPTPIGTFPILEKDADHVSNLYEAPMPHMLRLTWDGVALHGSPALADNLVTRGCIGLPREFAASLFRAVRVGDQVVVWDGVTSV
ncbi:MAG: L,D-transpeptidase family protein [Allosphingosinicella sp.]